MMRGVAMVLFLSMCSLGCAANAPSAKPSTRPAENGAAEKKIVLFDGTSTAAFETADFKPCPWVIVDGAMEVNGGDIFTRENFEDFVLHAEFRTPEPKPGQSGQGRGNSGIRLDNHYEIQVLESYGLKPLKDGCGSIYNKKAPDVNAALPPLEWQTYDITFRAPRFDASGKKTENARVTVVWNGTKVHDNVEITGPTGAGQTEESAGPGPIKFQDHGHPVQYRNIWIVPAK